MSDPQIAPKNGTEGLRTLAFVASSTEDYELANDLAELADQWDNDLAEIERLKEGLRAMMRFAPQYVPAGATEENFEALRVFRTAERLLESTNGG